jgi:hypothetical protein
MEKNTKNGKNRIAGNQKDKQYPNNKKNPSTQALKRISKARQHPIPVIRW